MSAILVLFTSAFAYESAPNISHVTVDGKKTLCGRGGWATEEGPLLEHGRPDCLRCSAAWEKGRMPR